ncbi:unnamed protein product [Penicillium pancosmium]
MPRTNPSAHEGTTGNRQANTPTPKLPFRTPSVPFHPSTSRPPSAMSENYSRRSSSFSIARPLPPTRPASRASTYPLSPPASARVPSVSMSNTHQPSYRPPKSIRSPTLTRKTKPQPQFQQAQFQFQAPVDKVELAKRLEAVEKERFQEGLTLLNEEWQELEALKLMDESAKNGPGKSKVVKKASKPSPAPVPAPALSPSPISKASAAPAILSKIEVICDTYSNKGSGCSEQSFHTARSDCTNESFHTALGGSDGDGEEEAEAEAEAEAEKAFQNSRKVCEQWQVELDRAQDERADSAIRDIANIGRK